MTDQSNTSQNRNPALFKIGAVAKETGVSVATLRSWERRHGFKPAERLNKHRYYSQEQVEHIRKIRALSEQGHRLSQLFDLNETEISQRLGSYQQSQPNIDKEPIHVIFVGYQLVQSLNGLETNNLEESDSFNSFDEFISKSVLNHDAQLNEADMIVLYQSTLKEEEWLKIREKTPLPILLVCPYYTERETAGLHELNIDISAKDDWHSIASLASELKARQADLSDDRLQELAEINYDAVIKGKHLVELVNRLRSYDEYLRRNSETMLHREIARDIEDAKKALERCAILAYANLIADADVGITRDESLNI